MLINRYVGSRKVLEGEIACLKSLNGIKRSWAMRNFVANLSNQPELMGTLTAML